MTRDEMVNFVEYVGVLFPQQKLGKLTPLAWHEVLGHLGAEECRKAAAAICARQPFIAPSEIIHEIADARAARQPHSNACRGGDHDDCRVSFCCCTCHPGAVAELAGPPPERMPGRGAVRGGQPRQLGMGDLPARP